MIPHNRPTFGLDEIDSALTVLRSGQWADGPRCRELELSLAARAGRTFAVVCGSGYSAIRLALAAHDVGRGDEVIVPAYACVSIANAVLALGAEPVPVDVLEEEWTLDPDAVAGACTPQTRAILAVHTFGYPARLAEIMTRVDLPVIEDCAHGFGFPASSPLGSRGTTAVGSLYATKLMGAGEGGMVLCDDAAIAERVADLRDCTDRPLSALRGNDKMTDIAASIALAQLNRLDEMIESRSRLAARYLEGLGGCSAARGWRLPLNHPDRIWYRFALRCRDSSGWAALRDELARDAIAAESPVTDWRPEPGRQPAADLAYAALLSLPLYPSLSDEDQDAVIRALETSS